MAITTNPPVEFDDNWYPERTAFDAEVKATANAAEAAAAAALPASNVAGLNTVGWVRAVWLTAAGTVPGGTPANTLVIRSAA